MKSATFAMLLLAFSAPAYAAQPNPVTPADTVGRYLQPVQYYGQCPLGAVQCFNGWVRVCQVRGNMTMWITGSHRC